MPLHNIGQEFGLAQYMPVGAGLGVTLYVDGSNGLATNSGTTPGSPLLTLTAALALCTNDRNDVIVINDYWQPAGETWPVVVNKSLVTIVGNNWGCLHHPWTIMNAVGAGDTACIQVTANYVKLFNLGFNAGATAAGLTFNDDRLGCTVTNCAFLTGQDGIRAGAADIGAALHVRECFFSASLTRDGIRIDDDPAFQFYENNIFQQVAGVAINILGNGDRGVIRNNLINLAADVAGSGITLAAGATGWAVDGNSANFGETVSNNPYQDDNGASLNMWGMNHHGNTHTFPA